MGGALAQTRRLTNEVWVYYPQSGATAAARVQTRAPLELHGAAGRCGKSCPPGPPRLPTWPAVPSHLAH
eukprot:6163891-Prymnesium_polylepis.1